MKRLAWMVAVVGVAACVSPADRTLTAQPGPPVVWVVRDRAGNVASVHTARDGARSAFDAVQRYETSARRRQAGPYRVVAVPLDEARGLDEAAGEPLPFRSSTGWTLTANRPQRFTLVVDARATVFVSAERGQDVPEDASRPRLTQLTPWARVGNLAIVAQGPGLPANGLDTGAVPSPAVQFDAEPGTYAVWVWADTTTPVVVKALAVGGPAR